MILEPKKIKSVTVSIVSPSICHEVIDWGGGTPSKQKVEVGTTGRGVTKNKMVGWHCQLNGHEFEQALAESKGQGSLACCSPWGHKDSDIT